MNTYTLISNRVSAVETFLFYFPENSRYFQGSLILVSVNFSIYCKQQVKCEVLIIFSMTFSVFSRVVCSSLHFSYCHLLLALQLAQILRNGGECPLKRQEFLYCHFKIRIITNYSYCNRRLNPINPENFRKSHLLLKLKL